MSLVCKLKATRVARVSLGGDDVAEVLELAPVYSQDPQSPNHAWSKATPAGKLELTITNPKAHGAVEAGKNYRVTIEPFGEEA